MIRGIYSPLTRAVGVRVGRLNLWLWAGSWSWVERVPCPDHCRNVYVGPLGFEWLMPEEATK